MAPRQPGMLLRWLNGAFLIVIVLLLLWGLMHNSSRPLFFGRYSPSYFGVLVALALVCSLLTWALIRPNRRLLGWLANAYLLMLSTAVAVLVVEIGLRVVNPWGIEFFHDLPYHMQGMVDHPVLGYEHPKSVSYMLGRNLIRLNSHGLRDDDIDFEKPPNEHRVLMLGDSVTFGWGVGQGQTFSDVLEARLRQASAPRWTVINAGVNGYNTEQEVAYFRINGRRYRPEIVVLTFVANDVEPIFDPNETTWRRYPSWPEGLPELADRARQLSYFFQITKLFAAAQSASQNSAMPRAPGSPLDATVDVTKDPRWAVVADELSTLKALCNESGAHLLIAINDGYESKLRVAIEALGIEVLFLEPAWEAVPPDRRHVSRIDAHPSVEVHVEMGKLLHAELLRRGWLEGRQ